MLEDYVAAGFDPAAFWSLTPRLYLAQMRGARRRMEEQDTGSLHLAWLTAALMRTQKFPSLKKLLRRHGARDTADDLKSKLTALSSTLPKVTMEEWRARKRT
ncbi:MAG: hypothetical protein GYB50_20295 [Rhodobacteraceae bacterium]|nr:hypothetical protein [Paracoccaceae bacterium]